MDQEQILSELTSQLGQTSLSERTLRDYIAGNIPEEGKEFDYEKHVKFLSSLNGQYSHDVAAQVEDFKKNYKPKADPEPKPEPAPSAEPEDSEIAKLLSRIDALEKGLKESKESGRKSSLLGKVEALKDSLKVLNKNLWSDCVNALAVEEADSLESLTGKAKAAYEKKLKDYFGAGAAPYGGKSSEQSQAQKKAAADAQESFKARMKAQGRL